MNKFVTCVLSILLIVILGNVRVLSSELTEEEKTNKELIEWLFTEGLNKQNPDAFDSVLADDYVRYCDAMPPEMQVLRGKETMIQFLTEHFITFPDWNGKIIQMVIEDDMVAIVAIGTGTMTGKMGPHKPTGKSVKVTEIMMHRFRDKKIIETWVSWDNVNFLTQAGLMGSPESSEDQ